MQQACQRGIVYSEDALAWCRREGCRSRLAWTCCDDADLLLERKGPGDHERAMTMLDEALGAS